MDDHLVPTSRRPRGCCARRSAGVLAGGGLRRCAVAAAVRSAHGRCAARSAPWPIPSTATAASSTWSRRRRPASAALGDYLVRQFSGDEVREPPAPAARTGRRQGGAGRSAGAPAACARSGSAMPAPMWRSTACACCWTRCSPSGCRRCPSARGAFMRRRSRWPTCPRSTPCSSRTTTTTTWTWTTVRHLAARGSRFFVPLGIGAHLERWGVPAAQIEETGVVAAAHARQRANRVHAHAPLLGPRPARPQPDAVVELVGDRSAASLLLQRRHRLRERCFQDIGARLGPFDMAFIKIGAYGPGASWIDIHMPPEQAVQVHRDVRAKRMFPVHWSTFNLAYHDWDEPIRRTVAEARSHRRRAGDAAPGRVGGCGPRVRVDAVVGGRALSLVAPERPDDVHTTDPLQRRRRL